MKKFRKLSAIFSLVLCFSIFLTGTAFAQTSNNGGLEFQISDNTTIRIDEDTLRLLEENNISIEEFKAAASAQMKEFLIKNNLSVSKNLPVRRNVEPFSNIPPGSTTETKKGSNTGKVWAGIPAIGDATVWIKYDYNYTKWSHSLYGVDGVIINSGTQVNKSYMVGNLYLGSWEHLEGDIVYANSEYGKNLEVTATGLLTFDVEIHYNGVTIPAHSTTEQSFVYYHAV